MSGTATEQTTPNAAANNKRRSIAGQGGLLNRMFGSSSNGKGPHDTIVEDASTSESPTSPTRLSTSDESKDEVSSELKSPPRKSTDEATSPTTNKRRSSKAGELFRNARQALHNVGGSPENRASDKVAQTPIQRLGKVDPALSVPQGSLNNSAGESHPGPRSTFRVGVTEDKNKKCRRTMEDTHAYLYNFLSTPAPRFANEDKQRGSLAESSSSEMSRTATKDVVETDNGYFAIFDGHAGTFAADWCGKKVHILLEDIIRKHPNAAIPELLDMTFTSVDQQLEKLPLKNSGCTAVTAVLRWEDRIPNSQSATGSTAIAPAAVAAAKSDSQSGDSNSDTLASQQSDDKLRKSATRQRVLYTANVGDARIVLCRNGKALRLSYDHKGSDENEGKRIAGAGGLILNNRVNGVLAVTRALGDAYMKDLVTGHPYTTETVIQADIDEFLILACDGLWDVCSDQESVDLIRNTSDPQTASKMLVDHALARFSTDNLSVMVVRFDNQKVRETLAHREGPIGVEGDKAGGVSEAEHIVNKSKRELDESGEGLERIPTEMLEAEQNAEPGPELNPEALEQARKDAQKGQQAASS